MKANIYPRTVVAYAIEIPKSSDPIVTIASLATTLTDEHKRRCLYWKIVERAGAAPSMAVFNWGPSSAHTAGLVTQTLADVDFAPGVSGAALDDIYVHAEADTAITACLFMYLK